MHIHHVCLVDKHKELIKVRLKQKFYFCALLLLVLEFCPQLACLGAKKFVHLFFSQEGNRYPKMSCQLSSSVACHTD